MTSIDKISRKRIKYIASIAYKAFKSAQIKNPTTIALECGAEISYSEMQDNVPAFCQSTQSLGTIFINSRADNYSKQILCAHELGHLLLHKNNELSLFDHTIGQVEEFEANLFAYFLYPKAFVRLDLNSINTIEDFNTYVSNKITIKKTL